MKREGHTGFTSERHRFSCQTMLAVSGRVALAECSCCGLGVVEAKCPLSAEDSSLDEAIQKSSFCLEKSGDSFLLKKNHPYYY